MPGKAKTRLVPPLTPAGAAALQRAMTEDVLERFARVFGADDRALDRPEALSLEVRCDGDPSAGALDIPTAWTVIAQGSGDLGERLTRAARDARRDGVRRLVIIGADAPLLGLGIVVFRLFKPGHGVLGNCGLLLMRAGRLAGCRKLRLIARS